VTWGRHKVYAGLQDFQADLGIDSGSRVLEAGFANLQALDCRLAGDSLATLRASYPRQPVPGVLLGERE
jgi:hypothetical protein